MFVSALGCGGWSQAGWQHPQAGIVNLDADFLYPVQVKSSRPQPGKSLRGILWVSSCVGWGRGGLHCAWGCLGGAGHGEAAQGVVNIPKSPLLST